MINKARKKLGAIKDILSWQGNYEAKIRLLESTVLGSMRWALGTVYPSQAVQQELNKFQLQAIALAMGIKRQANEWWVDYHQRMFRIARARLWYSKRERWGCIALRRFWKYTGHGIRMSQYEPHTILALTSQFRPLHWWQGQQRLSMGRRHPRHFAYLMGIERSLADAVGIQWRDRALDRVEWARAEQKWVETNQLPLGIGKASGVGRVPSKVQDVKYHWEGRPVYKGNMGGRPHQGATSDFDSHACDFSRAENLWYRCMVTGMHG